MFLHWCLAVLILKSSLQWRHLNLCCNSLIERFILAIVLFYLISRYVTSNWPVCLFLRVTNNPFVRWKIFFWWPLKLGSPLDSDNLGLGLDSEDVLLESELCP